MAELFPKRCKVYPRNGLQFIPGILEKQKRIEFPAELPLSEKELRRCLSYADVYEVTDGGDVLLTMLNLMSDNSKATPATDVPEVELQYPRDEKEEGDDEEETEEETVSQQRATTQAATAKAVAAKATAYTPKQQQTQAKQQSVGKQQQETVNKAAATTTEGSNK